MEARHDLTAAETEALEEGLYAFNRAVIDRHDGEGLAFVIRDIEGRMVGAAAGYSWAGIAELRQLWVDESLRGQGQGGALLRAFIDEADRRGVQRIWVATYDFQAPAFYERFGFQRKAELDGWPEGHTNIILCRTRDRALYFGLNRLLVGKPLGASLPAAARRASHSRHSAQTRVRPALSIQAAPSSALNTVASRRPPSR